MSSISLSPKSTSPNKAAKVGIPDTPNYKYKSILQTFTENFNTHLTYAAHLAKMHPYIINAPSSALGGTSAILCSIPISALVLGTGILDSALLGGRYEILQNFKNNTTGCVKISFETTKFIFSVPFFVVAGAATLITVPMASLIYSCPNKKAQEATNIDQDQPEKDSLNSDTESVLLEKSTQQNDWKDDFIESNKEQLNYWAHTWYISGFVVKYPAKILGGYTALQTIVGPGMVILGSIGVIEFVLFKGSHVVFDNSFILLKAAFDVTSQYYEIMYSIPLTAVSALLSLATIPIENKFFINTNASV